MSPLKTIAVVGAGTMGLGIAQVCAVAGFKTILFDINESQLDAAMAVISKKLTDAVDQKRLSPAARKEILSNIVTTQSLEEVRADMIIEAAVERLDVKQKLMADLEQVNGFRAILATNTSSLSVTKIAECLESRHLCIGLHFFNPADRMKLVEVISGGETDPALVDELRRFCVQIEKTPVVAKDSPGFIVNRVARHFYVESLKILEDEVAQVTDVDALLKSCGFRMGPFELMDLIGVDTNLAVTRSIYDGFNQAARFKPSQTQQKLVDEGKLGRKAGKGFYEYSK
jgi:3-hydroxybutyryl-CoA dehydrogenase